LEKSVYFRQILIGETESADLDKSTWQITSFFVNLTDEARDLLGLKRTFMGKVMVCLPVSVISSIDATAILNKTKQEILDLKQCKE